MPVFELPRRIIFPSPELANEDGLLAVGGDLSTERLLLAYSMGIFPWYNQGEPILWWSPDPRFVLFPQGIIVSKSMRKFLRKELYKVTFDTCFREVMTQCGSLRQPVTWIIPEMLEAYCKLHHEGFAHSVEVWHEGQLVGGLYGVSLGSCFFGESMFSKMDNASKTALIVLNEKLKARGFTMIDCQVHSSHLESLGAVDVPRSEFLELLDVGLERETLRGKWTDELTP